MDRIPNGVDNPPAALLDGESPRTGQLSFVIMDAQALKGAVW
jgi:hypothetical protein